jgi:uncharacterized protein
MLLADALTLDAPRRTADGFLAVRARAARVGVYDYSGVEIDPDNVHGLRDQAKVHVLRDEAAVFDPRAVRSFIGKPITDDHPREAVTAANWRDHARGAIMGAMRDGDHLAFDLVLMDAPTIAKVEAGKAELSNGYGATLEFGDFTAPDGTKCAVRQTAITGNHIAIVDRGRAGPTCRIGDAATCASIPLPTLNDGEPKVKTMLIDGLTVDIGNADTAQATITTILAARDAATKKVGEQEAQIAAKDTEIATLKTEKKALEDAKPTPAQLRDAAKVYAQTAGKAKALGVTVTDEMDEGQIMAATVTAKMGDAAKGWTPEQIAASFAVLAKDVKVSDTAVQPLGQPAVIADASAREQQALASANDHNAWRTAKAA